MGCLLPCISVLSVRLCVRCRAPRHSPTIFPSTSSSCYFRFYRVMLYVVCPSLCPSVCSSQAGIVSKPLDESSWFLAWRLSFTYRTLYFKEIWVSPKTLSQTMDLSNSNYASSYALRSFPDKLLKALKIPRCFFLKIEHLNFVKHSKFTPRYLADISCISQDDQIRQYQHKYFCTVGRSAHIQISSH